MQQFITTEMDCTLHKSLALEYFCESCMDPICIQCVKSNPHSNQYHRITKIQDALQNRKQMFELFVQNQINPLRQKTKQKLQQVKYLQSQLLKKRNGILKDVMLQFEDFEHRTKSISQKKILHCQTQIKYYQAYLNILDDLAYTFEKTSSDPYNFLILFQDIHTQLKTLQLKEITQKIQQFQISNQQAQNQNSSHKQNIIKNTKLIEQLSLPREIQEIYSRILSLDSLRERNEFLNELIAETCQKYQAQQVNLKSDEEKKIKNKLHIFNNMNLSIMQLHACKACAFCGLSLNIQTLNDQCIQNKSIKAELAKKYSHINIPMQIKGSKRHYWVDSSFQDRKVPDPNSHALVRIKQKKQFLNSLKALQIVKCCFKKYQIDQSSVGNDKQIQSASFMQPFEQADKDKKGILSKITFKYILTKTFEMENLHCDILTELFSYNWKLQENIERKQSVQNFEQVKQHLVQGADKVKYRLLEQFLKNPEYLYQLWQRLQTQSQKSKPVGPASKETNKFKSRY